MTVLGLSLVYSMNVKRTPYGVRPVCSSKGRPQVSYDGTSPFRPIRVSTPFRLVYSVALGRTPDFYVPRGPVPVRREQKQCEHNNFGHYHRTKSIGFIVTCRERRPHLGRKEYLIAVHLREDRKRGGKREGFTTSNICTLVSNPQPFT